MNDLDALLAGIVAHPHEAVRWLIVADWLDDHGFADRAELLRLHRMLIDTCCEPETHPERAAWQARIVELIDAGVKPCVPQHTLMLPGGVPLVGHFIPPGSFLMGGEEEENEKPIHKVTLTKGFFMGVHLVTQLQWRAVMNTDPSHFKGDEMPVEHVNWEDTQAFCGRASELTTAAVRLPTEAEWEYAARAGTTTHFHFGDVPDVGRMNYSGEFEWNGSVAGTDRMATTAVGSFASDPWGLFDCHGNVAELCADRHDEGYYAHSPEVDPACDGGPQTRRVVRGGSWYFFPQICRSAHRGWLDPEHRYPYFGFRVVFTLT